MRLVAGHDNACLQAGVALLTAMLTVTQIADVSRVFEGNLFSVDVQCGIIIDALSFKTFPMIKSRFRFVRLITHVPFAKEAGLITRLLKILRKVNQPFWNRCHVINNRMIV